MRKPTTIPMLAPKPVHPRPTRRHGLIGLTYVRQHMLSDERWSPSALMEQFSGMAELLARQLIFTKLETKATQKHNVWESRHLKLQCRDGRGKLGNVLRGDNTLKIRNFLINHKDMQRLYQKMPLYMVLDNINQRTFVMRKERDRLQYRMDQMKAEYKKKLLERALVENRIKYENEFVLEVELKARFFRKRIEDSAVRLKAIKTINNTYKRMIQVLQHDSIFYEPIVRSLNKDIRDQSTFINHILYLGMPAISKFQVLSEEYRQMEDKSRRTLAAKLQSMAQYRITKESGSRSKLGKDDEDSSKENIAKHQRYARETSSMQRLKDQLEVIERTIKQVKFSTLCSQATEIYPRFKNKVENNFKLRKMTENDEMGFRSINTRKKRAEVLAGVLVNNLSEEELRRQKRIKDLTDAVARQDEKEKHLMEYIKNRADAFVLLRHSLWNLNEMMRHVDRPQRAPRATYPSIYLKLPLLKYNMLTMRAVPPDPYEMKIEKIMMNVKRKASILMGAVVGKLRPDILAPYTEEYQDMFFDSMDRQQAADTAEETVAVMDDDMPDGKLSHIPSRRQIKVDSARLVEELSKRDDS